MAKRRGGHSRPQYSISTSIFVRKGKYIKGPSFGLWTNDGDGPMARGSVKEDYLGELREFLAKAEKRDMSVSFALFKNKKRKDEDDEEEDDEEEEEEDEDEDEEEEEEDEKASKKGKKKSSARDEKSGKKGKKSTKKSDWDFDDEDDD